MIRLELLGPVALTREDGTSVRSVLAQPKRLALLAYLAGDDSGRAHARDTLLGLLWPDLDQERARRALRQSLHGLRRSLGRGVLTGKGEDQVGIDSGRLRCDVATFARAVKEGRDEDALAVYRGDFLEGFHVSGAPAFERWVDRQRRTLRLEAVQSALRAVATTEREGDFTAARRLSERATALAPYDGQVVRAYMELMDRLGQPAAAVRAYYDYEARLRKALDLEPAVETRELVARIRRGARLASGGNPDGPEPRVPGVVSAGTRRGVPASVPTNVPTSVPARVPERGVRRVVLITVSAFFLLAPVAWLGFTRSTDIVAPEGREPIRSVAVLPFADMSPGGDQGWFGEGMAEEILNRLGNVDGLNVTARSSSFQFSGTNPDVRMVGDSLRVGAVLEGSVRRAGKRVRIAVQLVRTSDGSHLWSESFERGLDSEAFFEVQEEIARAVADALWVELDLPEPPPLTARTPVDLEAYSLYLRARHGVRQRNAEGRRQALMLVERALEQDPAFAPAWSLLAMLRSLGPFWEGFGATPDYRTSMRLALEAAERAVQLDPELADAHTMQGVVLSHLHRWEEAQRHAVQAVALNPSDPMARGTLLWQLASQGEWDRALEQARVRQKLDPLYTPANGNLAEMLMYAGHLEEAETAWRRTVALASGGDTHGSFVRSLQAKLFALQGRMEKAVATARSAYEGSGGSAEPSGSYYLSQLAATYALAGREAAADTLLEDLRTHWDPELREPVRWLRAFDLARVHGAMGHSDSAFHWLERSRPDRWRALEVARFRGDPWWAPIRSDPRTRAILGKVGVAADAVP